MRKIESRLLDAIKQRKDFRQSNTQYFVDRGGLTGTVLLFGNRIATVAYDDERRLTIYPDRDTFSRWPSVTTCSRLRALGIQCRKGGDAQNLEAVRH